MNYDGFLSDVEIGEKVLVDNGVMNLRVVKKRAMMLFVRFWMGVSLGRVGI